MPNNSVGLNDHLYRKNAAALKQHCKDHGTPCSLCGQPFNWELRFPHPMSYTTHHKIPRSKGGNPDTLDNMAPAHNTCNRARSNHTDPEPIPDPHSEEWP